MKTDVEPNMTLGQSGPFSRESLQQQGIPVSAKSYLGNKFESLDPQFRNVEGRVLVDVAGHRLAGPSLGLVELQDSLRYRRIDTDGNVVLPYAHHSKDEQGNPTEVVRSVTEITVEPEVAKHWFSACLDYEIDKSVSK